MGLTMYERGSGVDPFSGDSPAPDSKRADIAAWLRAAADTLGLQSWDIMVSAGAVRGDTSNAETFIRDDAEEAVIAIGSSFFDYPEPKRRAILAHELLHCQLHALSKYARVMVESEFGQTAERFFETGFNSIEEMTTDKLAKAIAVLLPVSPEWEDK